MCSLANAAILKLSFRMMRSSHLLKIKSSSTRCALTKSSSHHQPDPRPKRKKCEICRGGSGCRKRHAPQELTCPNCGHSCQCHYIGMRTILRASGMHPESVWNDPRWGTPDGCRYLYQPTDDPTVQIRCTCPGWPPAPPKPPRKTCRKKTISTVTQMELGTQPEREEECEP